MQESLLTLFAVPRAFKGIYAVIQRNAIRSWTMLSPTPEIILLGNDDGTQTIANEFGLKHLPNIDYSEYGTPRIDSMHREVEREAQNELLCIVNADIILMNDFIEAVVQVSSYKNNYMMMGQRHNLDVREELNFEQGWDTGLRKDLMKYGRLGSRSGEDYIVFPRHFFGEIPGFVVGHSYYDGWLLYQGRRMGLDLIDATEAVTVVHQIHDYNHIGKDSNGAINDPQTKRNEKLSGGSPYMLITKDRTHVLKPEGVKASKDIWTLWRFIRKGTIIHPNMPYPLRIGLKLINMIITVIMLLGIGIRVIGRNRGPRLG